MRRISIGIGIVTTVTVMMLVSMGGAMATDVDTNWENAQSVNISFSNSMSEVSLQGNGEDLDGVFHADDGNYERVEGWTEGTLEEGQYNFVQTNTLKSGEETAVGAWTMGGSGFLDVTTDVWRTGNDLSTHGYGGYGWPGTDSPAVGGSGEYEIGIGAMHDIAYNGVGPMLFPSSDSMYSVNVDGNGQAGIGTWKAGSTDIVQSGGSINANVLVYGSGGGTVTQELDDVGSVEFHMNWD